jgi:GTP cyclohydrolase I|tara:strand:- start:538 stop:1092 length:555 start_codon:yes stop_codon:yes gene_type:complete
METDAQYKKLVRVAQDLLTVIGEDPDRSGLKDTPKRFARYWQEFIGYDPGVINTTFETVTVDQMVVVSGIRVWSLCEHHLLPFWCDISVGYITNEKVIGLSKIPRICHQYAHRLQLQERLLDEIASELSVIANTQSVAVIGKGVHSCMSMRGIKSDGVMMSSVMRGQFKKNHETRMEFFQLLGV